ncbi:hypothetical protein [Arthrobacter sp. H35-D1]|uniref:hypothetical protein n=1 Tax=Arthrobacter sp. H35-D1 TaxID=3046202 RepID=UPI0024BADED7|nr:hypothetical protein [Arthrobacter sp. H35-D1]MDJ0312579.1 hypothetical protein [Arthrobacter sp. H35-D1]
MQDFWQFVGSFWWLAFPLAGILGGWGRAVNKTNERRHQRKIELYKLQHPEVAGLDVSAAPWDAGQGVPGNGEPGKTPGYTEADVAKVMVEHDAVNRQWLSYELDVAKMIDFPMMSDVHEPLTVAFLRSKRDADALRPVAAADVVDKGRWDDYRNAVNAYAVAFEIAEKEAHRIKDSAFSEPERQRLKTARKLVKMAEDEAGTGAERHTAYTRARKELDGLIVLPDVTIAALEQKIARVLERGD